MSTWKSDIAACAAVVLVIASVGSCTYFSDKDKRDHKETMLELKIEAKKVGL